MPSCELSPGIRASFCVLGFSSASLSAFYWYLNRSTLFHSTIRLRWRRHRWWAIHPLSYDVSIDVIWTENSVCSWGFHCLFSCLDFVPARITGRCTSEKVVSILRKRVFDPKLLAKQIGLLERCGSITEAIPDWKLNSIWSTICCSFVRRSSF